MNPPCRINCRSISSSLEVGQVIPYFSILSEEDMVMMVG
jgi:hypothetical protein